MYRPIDASLRKIFAEYVESTAYVAQKEYRAERSPQQMHAFSWWNTITSPLHTRKHQVCGKHGPVDASSTYRTAMIVADLLLGQQPRDEQGKLETFFCSAYVMTLFQGSFLINALQDVSEESKRRFLSDGNGGVISRDQLIKKILLAFEKKDHEEEISVKLGDAYRDNKLARYNTRYMVSALAVKELDKLSYVRVRT